jgi:distribution and morphology protein 10
VSVSTGLRFSTVPSPSVPFQPPTTITLTANPIFGHLQTAVACGIGRDLAVATRYDFNFHSFLSELSLGFEWWQRRSSALSHRQNMRAGVVEAMRPQQASPFWKAVASGGEGERVSVLKGRMSTASVRQSRMYRAPLRVSQ